MFRYLQLREYHNKKVKREAPEEKNPAVGVMVNAYHQKTLRIISKLYHSLIECEAKTTFYVKLKWEKELNITISEEEWHHMCETLQTSTKSHKWRELIGKS